MRVLHTDGLQARTLSDAQVLLRSARRGYEEVASKAAAARKEWDRREGEALKSLNDAQLVFDRAVSSERVDPPLKSAWGRKENPMVSIFDDMAEAVRDAPAQSA